jgi:RNA polymerase sigma-70 factor (ECF subfamily)
MITIPPLRMAVRVKKSEITTFFKRYGPMVYRRAFQILGHPGDAEEAMQEVFIRALKGIETFDGRSQVSTWLYRITTNFCLNTLRNRKRRQELFDEQLSGQLPTSQRAKNHEESLMVRRLMQEAPDPQWATAAAYIYMDGMTHQEASKALGVSRRTVGNLLDRFHSWAAEQLTSPKELPDT